jgi:hypothetical protein
MILHLRYLQVSLLACGRLMFHGVRAGIAPWFASLGYTRHHGEESDWLLDLVAAGFDKPEEMYGNKLMASKDISTAAAAFLESYVQVNWWHLLRTCYIMCCGQWLCDLMKLTSRRKCRLTHSYSSKFCRSVGVFGHLLSQMCSPMDAQAGSKLRRMVQVYTVCFYLTVVAQRMNGSEHKFDDRVQCLAAAFAGTLLNKHLKTACCCVHVFCCCTQTINGLKPPSSAQLLQSTSSTSSSKGGADMPSLAGSLSRCNSLLGLGGNHTPAASLREKCLMA